MPPCVCETTSLTWFHYGDEVRDHLTLAYEPCPSTVPKKKSLASGAASKWIACGGAMTASCWEGRERNGRG